MSRRIIPPDCRRTGMASPRMRSPGPRSPRSPRLKSPSPRMRSPGPATKSPVSSPKEGTFQQIQHLIFSTVADEYGGRGAVAVVEGETTTPTDFTDAGFLLPPPTSRIYPSEDRFAFGFDVDGVLLRGKEAIPEAREALRLLNGHNEYGIRIPFFLVTNGGGKTEDERCQELSTLLETRILPSQFICAHTPMRQLSLKYHTVLVIGTDPEKCRRVGLSYGFQDVLTTHDFIKSDPSITPFKSLTMAEHEVAFKRSLSDVAIEAILVLCSSRDWGADQQVILDLCMSQGGRYGTRSKTFDEGPAIYFTHEEVVWSTENNWPRIGLGAFKRSLEEIFTCLTGRQLNIVVFGKPETVLFQFAERMLRDYRIDQHDLIRPPETIYFVGDSPDSDVRGTNDYHESTYCECTWRSILVETGIYEAGTVPRHKPYRIVPSVLDAVDVAIEMEQEKMHAGWGRRLLSSLKKISRNQDHY